LTSQNELELLQDIASAPRATGSVALSTALQRVELELSGLGFETKERPFEFSAFPGRVATPLFGGAVAFTVGVAGHLGARGQRWLPLGICVAAIAVLVPAWRWLQKRGVLDMPVMRQQGINLIATRLGALPRVWLCAHLDTKSQPVPSLLRMLGSVFAGIGFIATLAWSVLAAAGYSMIDVVWAATALVTLVGAIPVVLSVVGNRSPGALDNASGVAAVIAAARGVPNDSDIGVLITDAEELGLAGAMSWARARAGGIGGDRQGGGESRAGDARIRGRQAHGAWPAHRFGRIHRCRPAVGDVQPRQLRVAGPCAQPPRQPRATPWHGHR
jgi:hypothetical protein